MDNKQQHEKFLYPVVRIFANNSAGSGTVIYSEPDPQNEGAFLTFILTNEHVIDGLIEYKDDWDSLLKKKVEKEFKSRAKVEIFSYVNDSTVDSSNRYNGDIIAYDKHHDLAIVKLDSPRKIEYVASILPKDGIKGLRLFQDVAVSGCSMAHEPFVSFGQLTFLKEYIEEKRYFMTNAPSFFGNSGGALFLKDTGQLIGVPSRITGIQLGFGVDIVTFMGFSCHTERIYEFLTEQELRFLYDSSDDYYTAMKRREEKEEASRIAVKAEILGGKK